MISSLCLALALVGQCPGGRCPARVAYYPAPARVASYSAARPAVAPAVAPPAGVPSVLGPAPYPNTPLPPDCRYVWNGFMWTVYRVTR